MFPYRGLYRLVCTGSLPYGYSRGGTRFMVRCKSDSLWSRIRLGDLLSSQAAQQRRKRLAQDLLRSPLREMREVLQKGGKFFPTSALPNPPEQGVPLPDFVATAVDGSLLNLRQHCLGHITLLSVCFTAYAEPHLESFRGPFVEEFFKSQTCRIADIRPVMGLLKWLIYSLFLRKSALQSVPEAEQSSYVIAKQPVGLIEGLEIPNRMGSFVYLVDRMGRVRWRASGMASEEEVAMMRRVTMDLILEAKH